MKRGRKVPTPVTAALAVLAVVISIWVVTTSAFFQVQRIDVRGNRRLTDQEIIRRSGIRLGSGILSLPLEEVERSLLRIPWIATVDASRSLPSTLVVRVTERSPVAWVHDTEGYAVLAGDGTVVDRRAQLPQGLVALGASPAPVPVGGRIRGILAPLTVASSVTPKLRSSIEEARAVGDDVELLLDGGAKVYYGKPALFRAKNAAIASMLRYAEKHDIQVAYLDVRSPTAPALKPVESS
jgi:cell division protein FtsQ